MPVGKPLLVWFTLAPVFDRLRFHYRAVVVAVVAVGVMEMAVDQVIDVVAVGDGGVTTVKPVIVSLFGAEIPQICGVMLDAGRGCWEYYHQEVDVSYGVFTIMTPAAKDGMAGHVA